MSYLGGCYLSGGDATAEALDDESSSLARSALTISRYKRVYQAVAQMSTEARAAVVRRLQAFLAALPADERGVVAQTALQLKAVDPRTAAGVGGPEGALSTVANVASILATLGTLGLSIKGALDARKDSQAQIKQAEAEIERVRAAAEAKPVSPTVGGIPTSTLLIGGGLAVAGLLALLIWKKA